MQISTETLLEVEQALYASDRTAVREAKRVLANPTRETLRGTCSLQHVMNLSIPRVREDFGFSSLAR